TSTPMSEDNHITPEPPKNTPGITTAPVADHGLPPVSAPSGKFIGQLFLVPGLIVGGLVLLLLFFGWLAGTFFGGFGGLGGGARTPDQFLEKLRDPNPDVRWRAAETLSQVLPRDDNLASDARFALDLTDELRSALEQNERFETEQAKLADDR